MVLCSKEVGPRALAVLGTAMPNQAEIFSDAKILIVDDRVINVRLLERILERVGYRAFTSTTDSSAAMDLYDRIQPDLVLLDLIMPAPDGFEILDRIGSLVASDAFLPVLVLTSDLSLAAKERALSSGANDFLTKPFEESEVLLRIHNLLQTRHLHRQIRLQNLELEERVRERTAELEEAYAEILERLARAAEYRDDDTGEHTQRVGRVAQELALEIGAPHEVCANILRAASLHDLGKVGIPDGILLKEGPLSPDEWERMQAHATIGASILSEGRHPLLCLAERIAQSHHESWDGTGYPHGLAGEAIPLEGRICAVADVFDALTHERPYKPAWSRDAAVDEITGLAGRKFDPAVVEGFLGLVRQGRV